MIEVTSSPAGIRLQFGPFADGSDHGHVQAFEAPAEFAAAVDAAFADRSPRTFQARPDIRNGLDRGVISHWLVALGEVNAAGGFRWRFKIAGRLPVIGFDTSRDDPHAVY